MACRNPAKAEAARAEVAAAASGPEPEVVPLDLADLDSVRACAEDVDARCDHLDVLLNNAGVMATPRRRTTAGFELQFGTNHLGHFALTGRLLPALLRAASPRVVTVASNAHKIGAMRWDDLNWERGRYSKWRAYGQTKLANLLFTGELQRRAVAAGTRLLAVAAHPGYAATHLSTAGPELAGNPVTARFFRLSDRFLAQSDAMGALPQLYAATMPDVGPDDYFGPDGAGERRGYPTRVARTRAAADPADGARLWKVSEQLTGVTYPWP
jgi:NAD(P)-dependent dehydrogenase (short-subunit alcohol dehydrogenase family)